MNIKLLVAYDGTNYFGWQKTETGPSIEGTLETVLRQILQEPIVLQAASRTDRGVHALGQVVNFQAKHIEDLDKLLYSVNSLLPSDIVVRLLEEVPSAFHPTLNAVSKTYVYELCFGKVQLPRNRHYSWHFSYPLNKHLMKEAAHILTGTHDYSSFSNQKKNEVYHDHIRTVDSIEIVELPESRLIMTFKGRQFLYKMVRNLVGTLAYVGSEKLSISDLPHIIENKDRTLAGITAPAHGLTLQEVITYVTQ